MSQFGSDRREGEAGREWSDAELNELGDMLVRGLSKRRSRVFCAGIAARSETKSRGGSGLPLSGLCGQYVGTG
jgi:hypothetical protein